ncbi:NADPH-dependent F420 reductase [Nocardia sp. CDC160]|uniref:NADPH-dependent F420 reductase n=1 Tax=Nocardia sp. CDC160 TaxID=3112166 RepID=UPI002DBD1785|nr:NAD(P)-binding domain-containing protein [Nocardia sp. CDC160]MEC3918409.1 NAD(P)-binding domain-containing protein [Nocardia sp. CDC160]MEC3919146.1 NAD(P)-binding domain-containing protein [Nocardia sp. CDC160]
MRIGTIGAGRMVESLAGRWAAAGHEVRIGARDTGRAAELATRIGAVAGGGIREAVEFGNVILFGVKQAAIVDALEAAGAADGAFTGKIIIDCGNAVDLSDFSQVTWDGKSLAEQAEAVAVGSRVVKAFNLAAYTVWQKNPVQYDGRPLAIPICGDDTAKATIAPLITGMGATPLDVGDLRQARQLEAMGVIIIKLLFGGVGLNSVFQFLPEPA